MKSDEQTEQASGSEEPKTVPDYPRASTPLTTEELGTTCKCSDASCWERAQIDNGVSTAICLGSLAVSAASGGSSKLPNWLGSLISCLIPLGLTGKGAYDAIVNCNQNNPATENGARSLGDCVKNIAGLGITTGPGMTSCLVKISGGAALEAAPGALGTILSCSLTIATNGVRAGKAAVCAYDELKEVQAGIDTLNSRFGDIARAPVRFTESGCSSSGNNNYEVPTDKMAAFGAQYGETINSRSGAEGGPLCKTACTWGANVGTSVIQRCEDFWGRNSDEATRKSCPEACKNTLAASRVDTCVANCCNAFRSSLFREIIRDTAVDQWTGGQAPDACMSAARTTNPSVSSAEADLTRTEAADYAESYFNRTGVRSVCKTDFTDLVSKGRRRSAEKILSPDAAKNCADTAKGVRSSTSYWVLKGKFLNQDIFQRECLANLNQLCNPNLQKDLEEGTVTRRDGTFDPAFLRKHSLTVNETTTAARCLECHSDGAP